MCNFGNRDELTNKERNIIKELGFKFRGKNNWIYFRKFEKGYAPYMPNRSEVLELDIAYLNSAIKERGYDKPLIPRLCILADVRSGMLLEQVMITPDDDEVDIVFASVQTLGKKEYLNDEYFSREHFDYVVIDGAVIIGLNYKTFKTKGLH